MEAKIEKTTKTAKPRAAAPKVEKPAAVASEKLAVLTIGGSQHLVNVGTHLTVDHVAVDEGKTGKAEALILLPKIGKGSLTYKVLEHKRGPKVVAAKYKAKSRYRRVVGSRAHLSEIVVEKIEEGK